MENFMKIGKRIIVTLFLLLSLQSSPALGNQDSRITSLEKRITALEKEIKRLQEQEARASKYLKCVQKVEGNALTVPFKILNCIRK
jgi:peptidoglycan hydrolase CwlO-like protein